ncbi:MAG: hypothetical protein GVY16_06040 [Planctomycetes bacterium]|jgi:hypothetical protein|nr:hypothetical protein [Planctomycetota bacterium]
MITPDRHRHEGEGLAGYSPPLLKPKRPARWAVFVALNLLTYLAACVLWHYLRSGQWVEFSAESYRRGLTPFVGHLLLNPVSIFANGWMGVVIVALLAMLMVVPLMTAVMYQLLLAMAFVVLLAVAGHAPLLALALAAACLMAARTRLRREYPFLAAAFALLPVCIYLYFAHVATDIDMLLPLQQWLLAVPLVAAVILALLAEFAVVLMARVTRFQPGVIWPVPLVLLPLAIGVFVWRVGPAELHYALLVADIHPSESLLRPQPVEAVLGPQGRGLNPQTRPVRIRDDLNQRRAKLTRRCRRFLEAHPDSDRAPSVVWILAEADSLQVDRSAARSDAFVSYTTAWPLPASAQDWRVLLEQYPASGPASLARHRLAVLHLRAIDADAPADRVAETVRSANQMLAEAERRIATIVQRREQSRSRIHTPLPSVPPAGEYARTLAHIRYLRWIMESNGVLPPRHSGQTYDPAAAGALGRMLAVNPAEPAYAERLQALMDSPPFRDGAMSDNLKIAIAKIEPSLPRRRAETLKAIAADERTDAAIEANFELGRMAMQRADPGAIGLREPEHYFGLVRKSPPNPFQEEAEAVLKLLDETSPDEDPTGDSS